MKQINMIVYSSSFLLFMRTHPKGHGLAWYQVRPDFDSTTALIVIALLCVILVTERQRGEQTSGNQVQRDGEEKRQDGERSASHVKA